MSGCEALVDVSSAGAAAALRAVDCLANQTAADAFGRLFGTSGAMLPALTILLTLYIAFFAVSLLTGRSAIGLSALTPRMMTLGMVLTFATSWLAYQSVVWNLAVGAPDQLGALMVGAPGSATQWFADRIDLIFGAVAEAAGGTAERAGAAQGSFSPTNLTWLASLLLLLGTVGVLVTARIALAVLLALGPIFVVLALFGGTRGLFVGWLRGVVLTAVTPLFVVIGGALTVEMLVPVVRHLIGDDGAISGRAAIALFLIAAVHAALMSMVLKISATLVSGWQIFGLAGSRTEERTNRAAAVSTAVTATVPAVSAQANQGGNLTIAPLVIDNTSSASPTSASRTQSHTLVQTQIVQTAPSPLRPASLRARGVGARFQSPRKQARSSAGREIVR